MPLYHVGCSIPRLLHRWPSHASQTYEVHMHACNPGTYLAASGKATANSRESKTPCLDPWKSQAAEEGAPAAEEEAASDDDGGDLLDEVGMCVTQE